eukprot:6204746-Pleurochrysis_carterae.AAC.2
MKQGLTLTGLVRCAPLCARARSLPCTCARASAGRGQRQWTPVSATLQVIVQQAGCVAARKGMERRRGDDGMHD